jgi:hypothetical protein
MFDRSAAVKLQLRDKKGKFIKMGDHVKWHSLEDDADVSGIARGQSGNNIIVEFSKGGQTYHINVPHNKVEAIQEKAHLDPAYVESHGGHTHTPNIHDAGVTISHTVTHYAIGSKDGSPLTTKIGDLKPGDTVYPIKSHNSTTPASIQKSPYNSKEPASKANFQKFNGHGTVKSIAMDKDTGLPKYAVITDHKGKDHFPSASHYAIKKNDHLDKAITDAHGQESSATGHSTSNNLVDEVKGTHTTEDKFNAASAPVGATMQVASVDSSHITLTKTGDNQWKTSNGFSLTDAEAAHMVNTPKPEKFVDEHQYIDKKTVEPANAPIDISKWTKQGGSQMGSNPGGIYTDEKGKQWYVKLSQSDDHARTEVLADQLYADAGVPAAGLRLADVGNGNLGTASPMIDGAKADLSHHLNDKTYMDKIQEGFAVDVWLANWDVAGAVYDNIITDGHGNPVRIDPGGALQYRAQGSPKGDAFGNKADEWNTLRNKPGSTSTALFGSMTDQQLADSATKVAAFDDKKIDDKVDALGFDKTTSDMLKERLKARRDDIVSRADALKPETAKAPETPAEAAPTAVDDHPAYDALDLFGMPNGAHFSSDANGVKGGYYKKGELWYMSFDPNDTMYGNKVPAHTVVTTLANNPSFKLDPESIKKTAPATPVHAPAGESEGGPGTPFYDKLLQSDKDELAQEVTHSYGYSDPSDPHSAFPGYNDQEAYVANDFIASSHNINKALRSGDSEGHNLDIATLDQILDKSVLKGDTVVYRGLSARDSIVESLLNGSYSDAAYSSTSTDPKIGHDWIGYSPDDRTPVFMEIHLPAGFKAHKLDYNGLQNHHGYENESEVILPHGTVYAVSHKEEYTNGADQKGWKITLTPILDEHNFDTGEKNDTGADAAGSPAGDAAGAGSEPVHNDGGPDSSLQPGGNEDHVGTEPSPAGSPEEEPQGQVAPATTSDNHPDFNATYADKGKDQIDANGATIKVNDLIHHPKKGVGKVFIGLPSTNSVKVVYPDGSKATHLSKAVTKLEGDTPQIAALPDDLKVGDHGIDPTTHTKYIVGTNDSLIHIGDTVTHSSGDKGTVKAIYAGEKTVSVKWDKGSTSTKKASTLESGTSHTPNVKDTTPPQPVQEPTPVAPQPVHAPEPAQEVPAAPASPETSTHTPAAATGPLSHLTEEDIANLPVGTVLHKNANSLFYNKKVGENQWQMMKVSTGQPAFGHTNPDKTMHGVLQNSPDLYQSMSLPETPAEAPEMVHTDVADSSMLHDPSTHDLLKLPDGTVLTDPTLEGFTFTKNGDLWDQKGPSGQNIGLPTSSLTDGSSYHVQLPTDHATESAPSAESFDGKKLNELSTPLDQLPVGTTITSDNHSHAFRKLENGDWQAYKQTSGNNMFSKFSSKQLGENLESAASEHTVHAPKVEEPAAATGTSLVGKPLLDVMHANEFNSLPIGSEIHSKLDDSFAYRKIANNTWNRVYLATGVPALTQYTDKDFTSLEDHALDPYVLGKIGDQAVPAGPHTPNTADTPSDHIGKTLTDVMTSGGTSTLPVGTELHNGEHVYKKTAPNAWQKVSKANGALDPQIQEDSKFESVPSSLTDKYTVSGPSVPAPPQETGASVLTGVSNGHQISKELLDAQPAGTSMKKESAYGSSAFYYIKQSDGTWKLFKYGQEKGTYTSDNIKAENTTATFGVPTSGSKFFYSKSGEITYEGDKVDYKGTTGKITSITDTGLVGVKLDGESKAKYKAASQLIKTPSYGHKDAPAYQPPATPDLGTTPNSENHAGGADTLNFAGASSTAYDDQGLSMPATTSDSHLSSGLTLAPTHAADVSNPLHGTPEPQPPTAPEAYPAFNAEAIAELPKWDSAGWLAKVKQRYADNPHKVAATLEESKNWSKIQTVLNGDEIHLDTLLQSKYLDEELKNEAIQGIVKQEYKNKPLLDAHNAKLAEAKKQYDAAKAAHIAKYDAQKQAFNQKLDQWVAANPNDKAMSAIQLPDTSTENFTGGPADWTKAHAGTFSAQSVFDSIKKDNQLGTKGLSIATDSDQVEALDANVMKIINTSGKPVIQVKMKLTGPYGAAFEKTLKDQAGVSKTSGIFSNHLVIDTATGLLKDEGQPPTGGWVHQGTRYSWTDPSTGATIEFQRSMEQGMNVSANNNTVRIHLPENSTPEDYQKVLENMGVNAKPSTEGDIRVLAENQLLSMMGKSTVNAKIYDGNVNLSGVSRSNQLKQIEEKYGVTPDDMIFSSEANGRVRFFLKDDKAQALTDKYGVKSFVHNVSGYGADTWLNMLVGPNNGLLSTFHRWSEGIGGQGMSSISDHSYGSSDYIYMTPKSSLPTSGHGSSVVINPKAIFRRTDWWANKSDSYGKKGDGTSSSPYNLLDSVTGGSTYNGGVHEALPKDSVPVSDWMYVNMDSGTRLEVIKGLKDRGVLQINGVPIEDFIRSSGASSSTTSATMPVVG